MSHPTAVTLHAAGQETASGYGAAVDLVQRTSLDLTLRVTELANGATLAVVIEGSPDQASWTALQTFSAVTSAGSAAIRIAGSPRYVRARWTLAGASATFVASGVAEIVYATPNDVRERCLTPAALDGVDDLLLDRMGRSETAIANGYLGSRYTLPLIAWGEDIRSKTADLIAFRVMMWRGFDPERGADAVIAAQKDDAVSWFRHVAANDIIPDEVIDSTPNADEADVYIVTDAPRGW